MSSDWFFDYWDALGLIVRRDNRDCVKAKCRIIVSELIGDSSEYWFVSFSKNRINGTIDKFMFLIKQCKLSKNEFNSMSNLLISLAEGDEFLEKAELLDMITAKIIDVQYNDDCDDTDNISVVRNAFSRASANERNFERIAIESKTAWDAYLRSLTPDLPTLLSDFLGSQQSAFRFLSTLAEIKSHTSHDNTVIILAMYRRIAEKLFGANFTMPELS
jgi:hypothetical protein